MKLPSLKYFALPVLVLCIIALFREFAYLKGSTQVVAVINAHNEERNSKLDLNNFPYLTFSDINLEKSNFSKETIEFSTS